MLDFIEGMCDIGSGFCDIMAGLSEGGKTAAFIVIMLLIGSIIAIVVIMRSPDPETVAETPAAQVEEPSTAQKAINLIDSIID